MLKTIPQFIKLISISSFTFLLSACLATSQLNKMTAAHEQKIASDQIIAIGTPQQPIQNYENAIILLGKKYSYLLQPIDYQNRNSFFLNVLNQLDLKYVFLNYQQQNTNQTTWKIFENQSNSTMKNSTLKNAQFKSKVDIIYRKPSVEFSEKDKTTMVTLNFNCKIEAELTTCNRTQDFQITLAQAIKNNTQIPYPLKHPIDIELYTMKNSKIKNTALNLLSPIAIAVDITTFPIQMMLPDRITNMTENFK